jgi:phenylacetate-CoA ligase
MNKNISKYLFYYPSTIAKGENIKKYLSIYEKFQYSSENNMIEYQLYHLKRLLRYAKNKSPFYSNSLKEYNLSDLNRLSQLDTLPELNKTDLSENSSSIKTRGKGLFVSEKTTGGSTGQAVTLLKNSDALARERAATWRAYKWAGVSIGEPQARFWGVPLNHNRRILHNVIDFISNRKRLSAFNINKNSLLTYLDILRKFNPSYLYGYVSFIDTFCNFIKSMHTELPKSVKTIITTSEVLTDSIRRNIENITGLKVFNEYGCGEVGSIAHECEYGNMHIMADNLIVEIDSIEKNNGCGEILVTDLFNYATPIIRYRLGDFGSISREKCKCGRTLPVLDKIYGRAYDLVVDNFGNKVHPEIIMYIFEDFKNRFGGIRHFQVIQNINKQIIIKIVIKNESNKETLEKFISQEILKRLGLETRFEYVNHIPREKSGKMRLIKSNYCD